MTRQEEIREAVEAERERIIALINLWRDTVAVGTSLLAGDLIEVINGRDEAYKEWMERKCGIGITTDDDDDEASDINHRSSPRIKTSRGHSPSRMGYTPRDRVAEAD